MPPAVGLGIAGLAGGAGAASGGKKGGHAAQQAANQQYTLQNQRLQFGKDVFNTGMSAWQPATNYYKTLLSGDPTAVAHAVGPISQQVRSTYDTAQQGIQGSLPAGGEKNLAIAQSQTGRASDLASLYANVQPTAANALGQLSAIPIGAGTSIQGQAAPNVSAGLKYDRAVAQQNAQAAGTLGTGLGSLLYGAMRGGSGGGGKKTPTVKDPNTGGWGIGGYNPVTETYPG